MTAHAIQSTGRGRLSRVGSFLLLELREIAPPTLFFFLGFNLILFTKRLFLADYLIQYTGFLIATTAALIVGKAVLVANQMPFLRRFDYAPLAYPILFKTVVYTLFVAAARLIEALVEYIARGGALGRGQFMLHVLGEFSWPHFIATQLWIFVLFLLYVTASELNELFGDGELARIFFTWRSSELKSTRRARIRLLARLSRLTDRHSVTELGDPLSPGHGELAGILRDLAGKVPRADAAASPIRRRPAPPEPGSRR